MAYRIYMFRGSSTRCPLNAIRFLKIRSFHNWQIENGFYDMIIAIEFYADFKRVVLWHSKDNIVMAGPTAKGWGHFLALTNLTRAIYWVSGLSLYVNIGVLPTRVWMGLKRFLAQQVFLGFTHACVDGSLKHIRHRLRRMFDPRVCGWVPRPV